MSRAKLRPSGRWLVPAALLGLVPKCTLCLLAYAGLGATLGLGGPELCGARSAPLGPWAPFLLWLGGAFVATAARMLIAHHPRYTTPDSQ